MNTRSEATGLTLESLAYPTEESIGFAQALEYDEEFRMGVNISWPLTYEFRQSQETVAIRLATGLRTGVLFDVEAPENPSKERWILVRPDGTIETVEIEERERGIAL